MLPVQKEITFTADEERSGRKGFPTEGGNLGLRLLSFLNPKLPPCLGPRSLGDSFSCEKGGVSPEKGLVVIHSGEEEALSLDQADMGMGGPRNKSLKSPVWVESEFVMHRNGTEPGKKNGLGIF